MVNDARLKSLFIMPALALTGLIAIASLVAMLFAAGHRLAWFGSFLAALPLPLVVARLMLRPVARTSEYLPLHALLMLVGLLLAIQGMYANFVTSWELYRDIGGAFASAFNASAANAPGLVALVSAIIFALYLFWYSRFGRYGDARLDVGSKLPDFVVRDLEGQPVQSSDFLGSPTVFLFYRGNWCPLCMAQIDELAGRYRELEKLGITVCLISSQPDAHTRALAEKHGVGFRFLVDTGNEAAEALGIAIANGVPLGVSGGYEGSTAMPTLFVTTAGGTIVFSDQTDNYRVRPEPDIFLAILRRSGAVSD